MSQTSDLRTLFEPGSVAVIGASRDQTKASGKPLRFLQEQGFAGRLYAVNPNQTSVLGIESFPNVKALPETPDLAVIVVTAERVPGVMRQAIDKGIKNMVILTSGFAEIGEKGRQLQEEIVQMARDNSVQVCGPNSAGLINSKNGMATTISQFLDDKEIIKGSVAFISQSGAFGTFILSLAREKRMGFKYYVSSGNEAILEFADYADYALDDPDVNVIAGYLEGVRDGEKFIRVVEKARRLGKPIVIVKVGRTERGARAAASHTASFTGSDEVYDAVFRQKGIIRANDEQELLDILCVLQAGRFPAGNRVGIVTMSGGAGVLMADTCIQSGLTVPDLMDVTKQKLAGLMPGFSSIINPIDTTGGLASRPAFLKDLLRALDQDENVDSIVIFMGLILKVGTQVANYLVELSSELKKFIAVAWIAGPPEGLNILRGGGVNLFNSPVSCIRTVGRLVEYKNSLPSGPATSAQEFCEGVQPPLVSLEDLINLSGTRTGRVVLTEFQTKRILERYGIAVQREALVHSIDEAAEQTTLIGYPVAMKVQSPQIMHKTEAKVVSLNIRSEAELRQEYERIVANSRSYMPDAVIHGVLVQEMINFRYETIIGATSMQSFGPVLAFGMGGILVEILQDAALRIPPLTYEEALAMVQSTKAFRILQGLRGKEPGDVNEVIATLLNVSRMVTDLKDYLVELDINPLFVLEAGAGVRAGDGLMVLNLPG